MSIAKEKEFYAAIEKRIEDYRKSGSTDNPYAFLVGFFEGCLPALISDEQASQLIERLSKRHKSM